jgi:NADPH2:quinone reductase
VRAAVCREHGGPEGVKVEEVPSPTVGEQQVGVRVACAAVNFPDVLVVANEYQLKVPVPFVPGSEFTGEVIEVGGAVDGIAVGDRVCGTGLVGAFAEAVAIDRTSVTRLPPGVDDHTAAAWSVAHRTAYYTLRSVARLQPGEELVVLGAGGGVGLATVQVGAMLGASVTAVASSAEKLEVARSYGATHTIDHRSVDLRGALKDELPNGADVVVDPVGGALAEAALRSLRWRGRFVTVGYASGEIPRIPLNLVLLKGIAILGFEMLGFMLNEPAELARNEAELLDLLAQGKIRPHIGAAFALDDTSAALRYVADGRAIGKVVIDIARTGS